MLQASSYRVYLMCAARPYGSKFSVEDLGLSSPA